MKNIFVKLMMYLAISGVVFQSIPVVTLAQMIIKEKELGEFELVEEIEKKEIEIVGEIQSERTVNEKRFINNDGTISVAVYGTPVHYEKDGKFESIDNTLVIKGLSYVPKRNNLDVMFSPLASSNRTLIIKNKDKTLSWGLEGSNKASGRVKNNSSLSNKDEFTIEKLSSRITYESVLPSVDLEYEIISDYVKESIIINNQEGLRKEYVYNIEIDDLKVVQDSKNKIKLIDFNSKETIFIIEAPYMYDEVGEYSNDISLIIKDNKLIVIPDEKWINDKDRVYPVVIDPKIISNDASHTNVNDTYIHEGDTPSEHTALKYLRVGSNNDVSVFSKPTRGLVIFNELPLLNAGDQIVEAYFLLSSLPQVIGPSTWTPPTRAININVHAINTSWQSNTATWATMNNKYDARIIDYNVYSSSNGANYTYEFDVTSIVKKWYVEGNNYGLMIKESQETNVSDKDALFHSCDATLANFAYEPLMIIVYRNQTGLLDYMTYHTQDIGRVTGYTNDYNGNQIFTFNDAHTPGNKFPVSINHVWNTNDINDNLGYGMGFRLNLLQTLKYALIDGISYQVYIDEDGTRHYFYDAGAPIYKDEDGLGLTLTGPTNGIFTMMDKDGNKKEFTWYTPLNGYRLTKIIDTSNNQITLGYTNDLLTTITDATGDTITLSYTGGLLTSITDKDGRQVSYTYNNNRLTKVTYPDNKAVNFTYHSGSTPGVYSTLIASVIDIDGSKVSYDYYAYSPNQVKQIKEHGTDGTVGNRIDIAYGDNVTTLKDNKENITTMTYNNWGQNISTISFTGDITGNDVYGVTATYDNTEQTGRKNKLTSNTDMIRPVNNYLLNSGFELDMASWQVAQWGINGATATTSIATDDKYMGAKSFKIVSSNNNSMPFLVQGKTLEEAKTYTLSAYIKTVNVSGFGVGLSVYYMPKNGSSTVSMNTPKITGTNDWKRYEYTFTKTSDIDWFNFGVIMLYSTGTVYIDNIQLEESVVANPYNLINNGGFDAGDTSWFKSNTTGSDTVVTLNNNKVFKITGSPSLTKNIYQNISVNGSIGDMYSLSYWYKNLGAKSYNYSGKNTDVRIAFVDITGTYNWVGQPAMNSDSKVWQMDNLIFVAPVNYKMIVVYFCFYNQVNELYIDNITLLKDPSLNSYTYNNDGNLVSVKDNNNQTTTLSYINNQLTSSINPKGNSFNYTYDPTIKNRMLTSTNNNTNTVYTLGYNSFGTNNYLKVSNPSTSDYIETSATYTSNGNFLTKVTDKRGKDTNFSHNTNTGTLTDITNANNIQTNYAYDSIDRITSITSNSKTNSYTYTNDYLNTITHNGLDYNFNYDVFGNVKNIKVGTQTLITNNYASDNGNLTSIVYGNNHTINYTYDNFERLKATTKQDKTLNYYYDNFNNLAKVIDSVNNIEYKYSYDLAKRLTEYSTNNFNAKYTYDDNSNVSKANYSYLSNNKTTAYTYDRDSKPTLITCNARTLNYGYDALDRLSTKKINNTYATTYNYLTTSNKTTTMISSINNDGKIISYEYDNIGNIISITEGNTLVNTYEYDTLSQLILDKDHKNNKEYIFNYDNGGNITSKVVKNLTTGATIDTINYTYTNSNWKDQLTNFNGKAITYDNIGNPLTYGTTVSYTWKNGRELSTYADTSKSLNINYKYDVNGIRTEKNVNGTITKYYTEGSRVIFEDKNGSVIYYIYDGNGEVVGFEYSGMTFYYAKNVQNDIIAIIDTYYNAPVAYYQYDAWGKVVAITDVSGNDVSYISTHLAVMNSYRYRSYYWDAETGFYYLNSRYYNPEWGRFINADSVLGANGDILSYNLYAYCSNNPVNYSDPTGHFVQLVNKIKAQVYEIVRKVTAASAKAKTADGKAHAATTYTEAASQNMISKQAVAHVINNRATNGKTIQSVVSAPYQFSGYNNAMYNNAMSYYDTGVWSNEIERKSMDDCKTAVIKVYIGAEDITGGSTLFYSPRSMPGGKAPNWNFSLLEEAIIPGINANDFRFYRYKK